MSEAYGRLPLRFEANYGQTDPRVRYMVRGGGYGLFLTATEAVMVLDRPGGEGRDSRPAREGGRSRPGQQSEAVLGMELLRANPRAEVKGVDELPGKSNYLTGSDPAKWRTGVPAYGKVEFGGIYPGVDLVYYGNPRQLEYDFHVAPGADPRAIEIGFKGARGLRVGVGGDLIIGVDGGEVRLRKPVAYQEAGGFRHGVAARYVLRGRRVGVAVGGYDARRPLVIDPILEYSTYLGGGGSDLGRAIAVDGDGNAYVTGETSSTDFPVAGAAQGAMSVDSDVFVTKMSPNGSALVYSTYLGGNGSDIGYGIAVDGAGSAYVTGLAWSTTFPTTADAPQRINKGWTDAFLAKLSPSGSSLLYSTYLGGNSFDTGRAVAVDGAGNAYVTGETRSTTDFPVVTPIQQWGGGTDPGSGSPYYDAFLSKISTTTGQIVYSTYLGGNGEDMGYAVAVDGAGSAYVTGETASANFPVANALQGTKGAQTDAFLTKFTAAGTALAYSTFIGGNYFDRARGLAVDAAGNAYVTGETSSTDFPVTASAYQRTTKDLGPWGDGFVTKLRYDGAQLLYSTYLGGSDEEAARSIAIDAAGNAYVAGYTKSTDFPTMNALQDAFASTSYTPDIFITALDAAGAALVYSTYFGGANNDWGYGVAVDGAANVYVTGITDSTNFPTLNPYQAGNAGRSAVLMKLRRFDDWSIYGRVTDNNNAAVAGATVTLGGAQSGSTQTNASGYYAFKALPSGASYTVTPSHPNYIFTPTARTFDNLGANQQANFSAPGFTISGRVADGAGAALYSATVTLGGTQSRTTYTDAAGNYSFTNVRGGGSYTVTPSFSNYTFAPPGQSFSALGADQTANFTGTPAAVSISGRVVNATGAGVSAVTVTLSGGQSATTQTNANGNYAFVDLAAGATYTVTPSRGSDTFDPQGRTFSNVYSDQTADFVLTFKISGRVTDASGTGLSGVTVTLSGGAAATTLTDAVGNYSFPNLPGDNSYVVTPSKPGYTLTYYFSPASRGYYLTGSQTAANFTLTGTATVVTLNAVADAHVQDGTSASTNYGKVTPLSLRTDRRTDNGLNRDVYFMFDLGGVSRSITAAKLRVYATLSESGSVAAAAYPVASTTWKESGPGSITWGNRPALSASPIAGATATFTGTNYAFYEFDVTSYVKSEKDAGRDAISLALHVPTAVTPNTALYSREAATNKPQLVITTGESYNSPPTVSLTSPAAGTTYAAPATVALAAAASDTDGQIRKVDYYAGTTLIGTATASPYQATWPNAAAGAYTITAVATDNSGATAASAPVAITVNAPNAPPTVSLTAPAAGVTFPVGANVALSAAAADADGTISKVEFFAGTTLIGTATAGPYNLTWGNAPAGAHSLTAKATDNGGATATSAPVMIDVVWQTGLPTTADTYVKDGSSAGTNFGTAAELQTQVAAGSNRETYLKFDLNSVGSVTSAKLRLFGRLSDATAANVAVAAYPVSSTSWIESGSGSVTWNTKLVAGAPAITTATVADNVARWYEWDVTSYVKTEKEAGRHVISLALKNTAASSPYATFNSKEATANRPQLVVTTAAPRSALLVTGSTTLNTSESAVRTRLQNLGFAVTVKAAGGTTSTAVNTSDAYGKAVVVISSTVTPANVGTKFRDIAVPVVNWESELFDDLGMTAAASGTDYGTATAQTQLNIVGPSHPMAAGLSGAQAVSASSSFAWGKPNANAAKIAAHATDPNKIVIFGYDKDVAMPGLAAPARRVGLFLTDTTAFILTTPGWSLFEAAVRWATEAGVAPTITALAPTAGGVGTAVTVDGYNFGDTQGGGSLTFNGVAATASSWSGTRVVAVVPAGATTGPIVITVNGLPSNGVTFTVNAAPADTDGDGLPDSWEMQYFGNLAQTAGGDPDGDGLTNLQEYQQGRNPAKVAVPDAGGAVDLKVHTPLRPPAP